MKTFVRTSTSVSLKMTVIITFWLLVVWQPSNAQTYAVGADLSFLKQAENNGLVFKENGELKSGLLIFKDHGYKWIRLRLFHTPMRLPNSL